MSMQSRHSVDSESARYTIMLEVAGLGHIAETILAAVPTPDALARTPHRPTPPSASPQWPTM